MSTGHSKIPTYYTQEEGGKWLLVSRTPGLAAYLLDLNLWLVRKNVKDQRFKVAKFQVEGKRVDIHSLYWGDPNNPKREDVRWDCINGYTV